MRAAVADPAGDRRDSELHGRLLAIAGRLRELQCRFERARDSRAVFAFIYASITEEVERELDRVQLRDPAWIVALAEAFAQRYFDAVDAFDAGGRVARAWRAVFDVGAARSSVLEDAIFPMTVHIVHDLPLALIAVDFDCGDASAHLHDFDRINDVMQWAVGPIRRGIVGRYTRVLAWLDRMERHHDIVLTGYGIRMSRSQAWFDALRLRDAVSGDSARRALEDRPIRLIERVRQPRDSWIGPALGALRSISSWFRRWPEPEAPGR